MARASTSEKRAVQTSEDSFIQANISNAAEGSSQAGQDSCPAEEVLRL
jgi:hypothetical protein